KEQEREKAASLRRFQGEAEKESCVALRYSDSALHLTPKKNTCVFQSNPTSAICSPRARSAPAQQLGEQERGQQNELFQQQAAKLSKTVKQVRRRLASCRTVPEGAGPPELPGGIWSVGARRDKPVSYGTAPGPTEDEGEEFLLAGHHDLPAELQDQATAPHQAAQEDGFYFKIEFEKLCGGSVKDSSLPSSPQRPTTGYRAPLELWAGVDREETKKQVSWKETTMVRKRAGRRREGERSQCAIFTWEEIKAFVSAGLRARRRTSVARRSRGCRRWLSSRNPARGREPAKSWPSSSWRRGD
ncbi:CCD15 protein, partial [Dromaius novaehollandiae]|nr:CCD15 protein [Dromaius novaehollandiae]